MAVVTTNLGTITAYGDAVAAGYTGTKAQWQALMANYATVGQQAAQDAQTASQAAQTATTKASEASASATAAAASAASITTPDATLTQAGVAADAKATGDEISELKEDLSDMNTATSADVGKALKAKTVADGKVTEWEFGDAGASVELDATLTDATKAAQAKATGDAIDEVKAVAYYKMLSAYEVHGGYLNGTKWLYTTGNNYKHIVIPVMANDVITVKQNSVQGQIAFFTEYPTPVDGENAHFSAVTGFTAPIKVIEDAYVEYTTPADAVYLYVMVKKSSDTTPLAITINGFDITKSIPEHISELYSDVKAMESETVELTKASQSVDFTMFSELDETRGTIDGSFKWANCLETDVYKFKHKVVPVKSGDSITVIGGADATALSYVAFLKSYSTPTNNTNADMSEATGYTSRFSISAGLTYNFVCPSDANYMYVLTLNNNKDVTPQTITINTVIITESVKGNLQALNELWNTTVNWAAMGDSITEGYYSYIQDGTPRSATLNKEQIAWAYLLAKANRWNLTNLGKGGSGFLHDASGIGAVGTGYNVARNTDFTPYNLVTIALGGNDWSGNLTMGTLADDGSVTTPTTVIGAMKATIEAIMTSNPACKIIVILPTNKQYRGLATKAQNYGRGYELSNTGTLDQFSDKIIEVCNYYGIQYIDMTRYSAVNRENYETLLPDGVHPSVEGHALIARELARKITFS